MKGTETPGAHLSGLFWVFSWLVASFLRGALGGTFSVFLLLLGQYDAPAQRSHTVDMYYA
jgi:hypothetical protein